MSPTQAREIIEAAGERIADWKSRLRINTGRGVETWDNQGSQLVSVSTSTEEVVKEPLKLHDILWASQFQELTSYPRDFNSRNGDLVVNTAFFDYEDPIYGDGLFGGWWDLWEGYGFDRLLRGEYVNKQAYQNPNALSNASGYAQSGETGYFNPKYEDRFPYSWETVRFPGIKTFRVSALYTPQDNGTTVEGLTASGFAPRQTSKVTIKLSVRTYTMDYLLDRANRGLEAEFSKGQSGGSYDFMIRREDRGYPGARGFEQGAGYPILTSFRQRVGFEPVTLNFNSSNNEPYANNISSVFPSPGWATPGTIAIVGYRKV